MIVLLAIRGHSLRLECQGSYPNAKEARCPCPGMVHDTPETRWVLSHGHSERKLDLQELGV